MAGLSVVNSQRSDATDNRHLPVICLMGTTATGKTDAAAALFDHLDSEIVSVDSSLVYRGMNIGTAKPNAEFLARYPHHLVDICDPDQSYSAAEFYNDAYALVTDIRSRGKVPILVGGTHFYFSTVEEGLPVLPPADPKLREQISVRASKQGWPLLHSQLSALDPESAQRIDPMDAQRIQRALEIVLQSGKTVAAHNSLRKPPLDGPLLKIALNFSDRAELHERIAKRFTQMLEQGLEDEIRGLLASGVGADAPSMRMIGYRQMLEFLRGDTTYDEMVLKGIASTRQLAKRQLTWLRNQSNVVWWTNLGGESQTFTSLVQFVRQFVI
jgi:tRNA dimethylallyltransferase